MKKYQVAIIGCSRSGTTYIARVLKQCGINVGHEILTAKQVGIVGWPLMPQSDSIFSYSDVFANVGHIFHIVRHPLKVIPSARLWRVLALEQKPVITRKYIQHIQVVTGISGDGRDIKYWMKFWLRWNIIGAQLAEKTFRVEDDLAIIEVLQLLGVGIETARDALHAVPTDVNSSQKVRQRVPRILEWNDLAEIDEELTMEIQWLAREYGYDVENSVLNAME